MWSELAFRGWLNQLLHAKFSRDIALNTVATLLGGISGALITVVFGRFFSATTLGAFSQAFALYTLLSILARFGLHVSVTRHTALHRKGDAIQSQIIGSAALLGLATTLLLISALLGAHRYGLPHPFSGDTISFLTLMLWALPAAVINRLFLAHLVGRRDMAHHAALNTYRHLTVLGLFFGFAVNGSDPLTCVWAFPLTELTLAVYTICWLSRCHGLALFTQLTSWARHHLRFGSRALLSGVIGNLETRIDVLMVGAIIGDAAAGVYSLAATVLRGLMQISAVITLNFSPIVTQLWSSGRLTELQAKIILVRNLSWLSHLPVILLAAIAFPWLPKFMSNDAAFTAAVPIFWVLLFGYTIISGFVAFLGILNQTGHPGLQFKRNVLALGATITLNAALIPATGPIGAAVATVLSFVVIIGLTHTSLKRLAKISLFSITQRMARN